MAMARTQTMVQLDDELVDVLDEEAAKANVSRSSLIRSILRQHIEARSERALIEQWVEGYRRHPQPIPDEWGDLDAQLDRRRIEMSEQLAADEHAAGHEPW
jgi:predicted transcriptional regulator